MLIAELWGAKRACGAPWVRKYGKLPIRENLVITWPYTDRPSAPQAYQCLLSHFLATLGAQEKTDCTSMLWSIDSCQNKVSADQYHLAVSRAEVSTHAGRIFLKLSADKLLVFRWSQAQVYFLKIHRKYVVFMSLWPSTIRFQTDLGRENSASYL